jgi:phospho-N-acetylmuramoyl-pentapeptide-transferase
MLENNLSLAYLNSITDLQRACFALITALLIVIIFGNPFIRFAKKSKQMLQPIRSDGPQTHFIKQGTPTLGGLLIMIGFFISSFLWIKDYNNIVLTILMVSGGFALIGLIDDLMKLILKNSKGVPGILRLILGIAISLYAISIFLKEYPPSIAYSIYFPFVKPFYVYAGICIFIFGSLVIVGTANSVNLSDGLDGLASVISITVLIAILVLLILMLNGYYINFSYQSTFYFNKLKEILVLISALIGGLMGFLWFNSAPAKIFMGDVGSLGIGGALGAIVVALKQEVFLSIVGLILVIESISVILQVGSYKLRGKRIFLMAPIHHHFEKKGYKETKIVFRIWIFTIITCIVAFLLLGR